MNNINEIAQEIIELLRANQYDAPADDLENCVIQLSASDAQIRAEAAQKIKQMCNVRWLGDLYIPNLSQKEWWDKLEKLSKSV